MRPRGCWARLRGCLSSLSAARRGTISGDPLLGLRCHSDRIIDTVVQSAWPEGDLRSRRQQPCAQQPPHRREKRDRHHRTHRRQNESAGPHAPQGRRRRQGHQGRHPGEYRAPLPAVSPHRIASRRPAMVPSLSLPPRCCASAAAAVFASGPAVRPIVLIPHAPTLGRGPLQRHPLPPSLARCPQAPLRCRRPPHHLALPHGHCQGALHPGGCHDRLL